MAKQTAQERQMRVNEKLKYLSLLSINGELDAEIVEAGTPFYSYAYNMDAINDEVEDIEFMLDTPVLTVPKGFRNFRQIQNLDIPSNGKLTPDRLLTIPIPDTGDTCYIKATCLLDAAKEDRRPKQLPCLPHLENMSLSSPLTENILSVHLYI